MGWGGGGAKNKSYKIQLEVNFPYPWFHVNVDFEEAGKGQFGLFLGKIKSNVFDNKLYNTCTRRLKVTSPVSDDKDASVMWFLIAEVEGETGPPDLFTKTHKWALIPGSMQ